MTEKNKLHISLFLDGDLKQKFEDLKKKLGIKNNSDIIRYILKKAYDTV